MKQIRITIFLCLFCIGISPTFAQNCWPLIQGNSALEGATSVSANTTTTYVLRHHEIDYPVYTETQVNWTVTGGTITSQSLVLMHKDESAFAQHFYYDEVIEVSWSGAGTGSISASLLDISSSGTGCPATLSIPVSVISGNNPAPAITGCNTSTLGALVAYTTPASAGNSYTWSVSAGEILGGQGTNTVIVRWGPDPNLFPYSFAFDPVLWSLFWMNGSISVLESNGNEEGYGHTIVPFTGPGFDSFSATLQATETTVYPGYAPAECTTISVTPAGGSGGYSYEWSNGATTASISVCPAVDTDYSVSVTDANGCFTYSLPITIEAIPVSCGNNKVSVCHNGRTRCVKTNQVAGHLAHGDVLGSCTNKTGEYTEDQLLEASLNISQKFSSESILIQFYPIDAGHGSIALYDVMGRTIKTIYDGSWQEGETIEVEFSTLGFSSGIYFIRQMEEGGEYLNKRFLLNK